MELQVVEVLISSFLLKFSKMICYKQTKYIGLYNIYETILVIN